MKGISHRALAAELALAVEEDRLDIVYQPKIALDDGALAGVEALARWHHPRLGDIPPSQFIPAAEEHGAIGPFTDWLLRRAFHQWCAWRDQGLVTCLAVNLSALSLRDLEFPDRLDLLCRGEGVPSDHILLEITESATQKTERLLDTLTRFRIKGFGLSLDDFGTGYSSLLQLRQLPYSELKIDCCFVRDAAAARESRLIVESVVRLAHGLGLIATAEGVEDEPTLALLRRLGCDRAQGFFIAAPMPGAELVTWWLTRGETAAGRRAA
ncbi:MAG TPA: EAL domain-containing protein [Allosphingosinicella sp.]|jgi:EAL domain-containing protein (putative c-di-GMP-specific phosphodiesterase class I)